jgi:hypothetical protein
VLAIIIIFTTGFLLDICAAYFIFWEMGVFKRHLDRHASWLIDLIERYKEYSADDYQQLHNRFGNLFSKEEALAGFSFFLLWKRERRRRFFAWLGQVRDRYRLIGAYDRLWSFFISYVIIQSGSSQLSVLTDLISQWRVGRALSTAMFFFTLEMYVGIIIWPIALPTSSLLIRVSILPLVFTLFVTLNPLVIVSLYSRVCHTLFSLAYVTKQKESSLSAKDLGYVKREDMPRA